MDILNAIPSNYVREYIKNNNWQFSDIQKASIVYHSLLPLTQRISMLDKLGQETGDKDLSEQIRAYLTYINKALSVFSDNTDRRFIYRVIFMEEEYNEKTGFYDEWSNCYDGCFLNLDNVVKFAADRNNKCIFKIKKCAVFDESADYNNRLIKSAVSTAWYNVNGEIVELWENELPQNEQYIEDRNNFTFMYADMPNPFELGDITAEISPYRQNRKIHIINTSQKAWSDDKEHIKNSMDKAGWDYSDIQVTTSCLRADGVFVHEHINPLFLEKIDLPDSDPRQAVIEVAASTVCGRSSLDWLQYYLDKYKLGEKCHI
ncbi:MAG: hypothetical protein IJ062_04080 [Firmicutes bacterium]|nr:hypothetical protein [Bacillota bacterium]